ncbi:zinc finger protein [Trichonephila clavipes]|nr:zinc finger protein [Trichonephila clavipes]
MRISHKRLIIWKTTFAVLLPIYGHKCWKKSSKIGRPDWTTSEPAVAVLCQKSYLKSRAKVARFKETFPQAELRRLDQAEREAAHRAAETPEQSQGRRYAEYLASQRAAETPEQSQALRLQHATYMASQRCRNH